MEKLEISLKMSSYIVYMHENRVNGKKYIGITSGNPYKRWANGTGYYRNKHFSDAIRKYGWDAFDHKILYTGLTKQEACEMEQTLIAKYDTQNRDVGYNITNGGEHFKHTEESKRLMSERRKGLGRKKRTAEQIENMKAAHKGGADKRPVRCVDTGDVYMCINDASRATGINKKGISSCCRHIPHYNTAGGKRWEFLR